MADKKLTPMMELIYKIENDILLGSNWQEIYLEKERQMVIDVFEAGIDALDYNHISGYSRNKEPEQYYNETFKTK